MTLQNIRQKSAAAAAVVGMGALLVGCSRDGVSAAQLATAGAAPLAVSCEPNRRAVVRQVAVNGAWQPQVQCESVGVPGVAAPGIPAGYGAATPVAYQPGYQQVAYAPVAPLDNTRIVRTTYPEAPVVTREAAPRRIVSQRTERVAQPKRSVKKSAVIIGSSAGVGAGIGAVVGGKKGAGIGALLGGGGAAVWDQITRRRQ